MGLFDTIMLPTGLSLPAVDQDSESIEWQTKSFDWPCMGTYRVTTDGRLFEEEFHTEFVSEDERPYYDTEKWDTPLGKMAGSRQHVHDGWTERQYHGVIEFHATIDETLVSCKAKFTDGRADAIRQCKPTETEWVGFESLLDDPGSPNRAGQQITRTQEIHLRALLDEVETEIDDIEGQLSDDFDDSSLGPAIHTQRARRAIEDLKLYLDWRLPE